MSKRKRTSNVQRPTSNVQVGGKDFNTEGTEKISTHSKKRGAAPDRARSPGQEAEGTGGESRNEAAAGDASAPTTKGASGEIFNIGGQHGRSGQRGRAKCVPERETLLLPYQKRWVEDRSRLKLAEKSRQIGWTWATAYDLVRKLSVLLGREPEESLADARGSVVLDEWISSRDELQAKLFIQDLKNWARVLQVGAEDLGERVIDEEKQQSAMAIRFATGAFAYSLSSNADAQAGKRGGRTLDEFALHRDPRRLYAIAYPGITWGGQLSIFSTHRGSANFFNELVQEIKHKGNPKKFSFHRVTLQDALDQGFLHKLQSKLPPDDERQAMDEATYFDYIRSGCADEETFAQEYMCVPGDDASAFLSYDLIAGCEYALTERWEFSLEQLAQSPNPLYLGMDVGRKKDLTVMWVLERVGGIDFTRRLVVMEKKSFAEQEAVLYELLQLPGLRRACLDASGIGMQLAERAQQRFGEYKVEAVTFTAPVKEELAYPVKAAFEDRSVRIPNDAKVRSDLRAIRKETTAAGNIRFTADAGPDGHSDRFWALALAKHAGKQTGTGFSATLI